MRGRQLFSGWLVARQDAQKGRLVRPSFVQLRSSLVADPDAKFL